MSNDLKKASHLSTRVLDIRSFVSGSGVVIKHEETPGFIVTISSISYYNLVAASIAELEGMGLSGIAAAVDTSHAYAGVLMRELTHSFRKQLSLTRESNEVAPGVIVHKNGAIIATGIRFLPKAPRKTSKANELRRKLPIGKLAAYPVHPTAIVARADTPTSTREVRKILASKLAGEKQYPMILLITDSYFIRSYLGGAKLFHSRPSWDANTRNRSGVDPYIIALGGGPGGAPIAAWRTKLRSWPLARCKHVESSIMDAAPIIDSFIEEHGGANLAVYITRANADGPEFGAYLRERLLELEPTGQFMARIYQGPGASRRGMLKSIHKACGDVPGISYITSSSDYMVGVAHSAMNGFYETVYAGFVIPLGRVTPFLPMTTTTIAEISEELGCPKHQVFVKAIPTSSPPYMYRTAGGFILSSVRPATVGLREAVYARGAHNRVVIAKQAFYHLNIGSQVLLATK